MTARDEFIGYSSRELSLISKPRGSCLVVKNHNGRLRTYDIADVGRIRFGALGFVLWAYKHLFYVLK